MPLKRETAGLTIQIGWGLMVLSLLAGCNPTTDQGEQASQSVSATSSNVTAGAPDANQSAADSDTASAASDAEADEVKAGGLGVTTAELHAAEVNLQQYVDVDSVMDQIMRAQYSPSQQGVFAVLGVNPRGKDAAQLLPPILIRAQTVFLNYGKNMDVMESMGVLNLISPEDLVRLSEANPEDFEKAVSNVSQDVDPAHLPATSATSPSRHNIDY